MKPLILLRIAPFIFAIHPAWCQQNDTSTVAVLDPGSAIPPDAQKLGEVKAGKGIFKAQCDYDDVIAEASDKARELGANMIWLTKLKEPTRSNTCYRLEADAYKVANPYVYAGLEQRRNDSIAKTLLPDTANYALLYIYRPRGGVGTLVSYNMHLNDSVVCRIHVGSHEMIKVYRTGITKIWTRTEARAEIELDIKPGKAYFVKCGVTMGYVVGEPSLRMVGVYRGLREFNNLDE